jgi:hypothetical protein
MRRCLEWLRLSDFKSLKAFNQSIQRLNALAPHCLNLDFTLVINKWQTKAFAVRLDRLFICIFLSELSFLVYRLAMKFRSVTRFLIHLSVDIYFMVKPCMKRSSTASTAKFGVVT